MRIERDQVTTMVILLAITIGFALGVWWPLRNWQQGLQVELDTVRQQINSDRGRTVGLTAMGQEVVQLQAAVARHTRVVPRTGELASLIRDISAELKIHQIADPEINTLAAVHGDDYSFVPLTLRFRGSFLPVFRFLRNLESMDRLLRVSRLELSGDPQRPEDGLMVRLELAAFYRPTGGTEQ